MNVIVTGSLGFDYIMDFSGRIADRIRPDAIHKISLSLLVDNLNKQFGGTAGNIAYTLSMLSVNPLILSYGGNDFDPYKAFLEKHGITTKYIAIHPKVATGTYFVVTDADDNQIGAFSMGALKFNDTLSLSDVKESSELVVIAPNKPEAMTKYVRHCRQKQLKYLYDPAFQIGNFTKDELLEGISGARILIGNDYEIGLIEEKLGITHEDLRAMVPVLVSTLGAKGSIVEDRKRSIHIKPVKAKKVIDPTGAGDAYRGGFVAGYVRGFDLVTCAQMGSVAAVYTVEKYGTVTHKFTAADFAVRYGATYGELQKL